MKITPEAVKERIAALESAGELSLKEQFYLEALRQLVAESSRAPVVIADLSKAEWDELESGLEHELMRPDGIIVTPPAYPKTLPCPVLLEPGLRFGKGVATSTVLKALQSFADHYAELEAMTPEERAEHDANIEAFKAMLPQPAPVVPEIDRKAIADKVYGKCSRIPGATFYNAAEFAIDEVEVCRAAMIQAVPLTNEGDIALHNYRTALDGIGHIRRTLEETFGGLHGTHVEPDVLIECKTICDAIYAAYRGSAQGVPDEIECVATTLEHIGNFAGAAIIRQLVANQQQNAPQNIPEIIPDSCTWHCEEDINNWHSDCGYQFQFMEDGPEENGVKFCPKCGKSVAVSATEGTEE